MERLCGSSRKRIRVEARRHLHGVHHRGGGVRAQLHRGRAHAGQVRPLLGVADGRVLVSLGFFLCAYTTSLNYLFVCFGVIGGLGNGFGYATPIPVMAKWFPDKRGLAVGLAVGGYGAGSAIFGPLRNLKLIPAYGVHTTFQILGGIFLVMTMIGALLLKNPPAGYKPAGWTPAPHLQIRRYHLRIHSRRGAAHAHVLLHVGGLCAGMLGRTDGHQPTGAVRQERGHRRRRVGHHDLVVGAVGNASGRILSGWMSDALGRFNVLRLMIAISHGRHAGSLYASAATSPACTWRYSSSTGATARSSR